MSEQPRLSVVTVCMNRREHLLTTAPRVAAWPHHHEHLIVDWSSREPLRREDLPDDPRLRLLRVEGESRWNLCRAYNFALGQASGTWLLKLDADCWPTRELEPSALLAAGPVWVGSGGEGRYGQFLMERSTFASVGGFNEYLRGWGFDDKDLRARLEVQQGLRLSTIPTEAIGVIEHSNEERMGQPRAGEGEALRRSLGLATMRSSRLGNRLLAAHHPWGPRTPASVYEQTASGLWRVVSASVPRPTAETADEIDHARRMAFWSCFLAIPDVFLAELPPKLAPPSRQGRWAVRWWHRLWWHSGRRLLELPVLVLGLGRGRLERMKRALGPR
ncbi:glycosyltransferase family 2 protein [Synechococcus sp. 1G10]|uniref:glycosyltransferase family 2 protein n=1 Tax=Synechococcus sp. 1G10 TaxID=2025605 RepID=UPI000B9818D9|nr:glycosyltransferase family A protein [Synechococcus sp. 1G10]